MPLGEAIAEVFGSIIAEGFIRVVVPILRVPGVLLEVFWKKRWFLSTAWEKGNAFWQAVMGALVYTMLVLLAIAAN